MDTNELRKASQVIFLAVDKPIADDISFKLNEAADTIDHLREFAIWLTGCGYDFTQHEYFIEQRELLLKTNNS
jgi:hypothetical protein